MIELFFVNIISLMLLLFMLKSKVGRKFRILNIVIFVIYNSVCLYNYFYNGKYGSAFVWLFYLFVCIVLQMLFCVLVLKYCKK